MRKQLVLLVLCLVTGAGCGDDAIGPRPVQRPDVRPTLSPMQFDARCIEHFDLAPAERAALRADLAAAREPRQDRVEDRQHSSCDWQGPPQYKQIGCDGGVCLSVWTDVCGQIFFQVVDEQQGVEMWLGPGGCTDCRP